MKLMELVRGRRSVRTFDGNPISEEKCAKILDFAGKTENPYGIGIEWFLLSVKRDGLSVPVITGADTYIAGKMKKVPHAEEAFGYAFEQIVLYCQSLGIGTTIIAGTMDRKRFEEKISLQEDEVMPCVSPLGYPAEKMSFRETMMRKGIKADTRLPGERLFFAETFDRPLVLKEEDPLYELLETVRLAPSAVNRQPWRLIRKDGYIHFYEKKGLNQGDDWDVQKIDIGIAMTHFALGLKEQEKEVNFSFLDPKIPAERDLVYIASVEYH
ncbi:MAG: hypothetical protein II577_05000 [Erysipelotrichaceae bacterium]|nr:hypothetical protein [Erysipelotrichaceae bacterium]